MAGLLTLADRMAKLRVNLKQEVSKAAAETAITMVGYLVFHTPVDTSKALSSWIATFDAPSNLIPGPHFPGKYGSTYKQSAAEALAVAKRVLEKKEPGQTIYITNNQPYIEKLNDGTHSAQPGGFKEAALLLGNKQKAKFKFGKL